MSEQHEYTFVQNASSASRVVKVIAASPEEAEDKVYAWDLSYEGPVQYEPFDPDELILTHIDGKGHGGYDDE